MPVGYVHFSTCPKCHQDLVKEIKFLIGCSWCRCKDDVGCSRMARWCSGTVAIITLSINGIGRRTVTRLSMSWI